MQNVYAFYLKAKQKTGKPSLFIWFDAKNDDRAQRDLANYIEDAELEPKDYFKAARTDYPVYDDLPPEGEFSNTWCDRYELADDKRTWQIISEADKQLRQNQEAAGSAENGRSTAKPQVVQEQQKPAGEYLATNLDKHTVIAAAWLYGRECLKLNEEQLKAAKALVMDDAQRYPQNVILALTSLKQHEFIYPDMPIVAIAAMKAVWLPFGKAPELGKLCQFATEYLDAKVEERADVITKWQTGGAKPVEPKESKLSPTATVIAAIGDATLQTNTALSIIGVHPSQAKARDVTNAKAIEDARDPAWRAWYNTYRVIPGIQQVDADTRHAIISEGLKNLKLLTDNEARLHFVKSRLAGHPACPELADYTQPAPANDGVDAENAQQKQETAQQNTVDMQQTASNEGGKEEVSTADTTIVEFETERRAWIRGEVVAALSGDTGVMGEDDVAELMAVIGEGVSHTYVARLLAKEIEPCDPFQQLAADEIHHLTCDVLENWVDDKDPRVAFINGRVEFYLEVAQQHQSPAKGELGSMGAGRFDVTEIFGASPLAKVATEEVTTSAEFRENEDLTTENVREFLNSSTKSANVSGETAKLSGERIDTAAQDEVQSEATAAADDEEPSATAPAYFEPGRYLDIPNEVYHSANGISSTMAKDARISLMYYHGRHVIKSIQRERTDALTFGSLVHTLALEPEKLDAEFSVEPLIPEGAFTDTASMRAFIDKHNAALPKQADADTLRAVIEKHNATLPVPYALGGNADEIGQFYGLLPVEFQRIGEDQKPTATAMKACIKEYNATLPVPLKTSGSRDALLEQLEAIDPAFVQLERAIPAPLPVSGSKEDMAARIKTILPTAVFADELISAWKNNSEPRQTVTQQQFQHAKAIQYALLSHPLAGKWLQHPQRDTEVSYFGIDEETGLDVRVRPDLEVDTGVRRIAIDLKTVSLPYVKQDNLRQRLHREIIERDYHMSAGMYCDVGMFDQFFWIFVNKEPGYHWVAVVEASADELALGRAIYKQQLAAIRNAMDTGIWPEPITEVFTDTLTDYELSRLKELNGEPS
ncbi:RecE family exodeoxyribonuclease [Serratia liquefaciens]|uniref:RecE family exodeoxyribonuclease n=1 Tax=Serratia liquefaciens TaxID=614 RepID=UPI003905F951